jgi:hypothetical protein
MFINFGQFLIVGLCNHCHPFRDVVFEIYFVDVHVILFLEVNDTNDKANAVPEFYLIDYQCIALIQGNDIV